MKTSGLTAAAGIALSTIGTICFAYEAIKVFRKSSFEIKSMTYSGRGIATKTQEFDKYDGKRIRFMWLGLILTVLGNAIQFIALFLD
jgi:hypothetical protein